MLSDVYLSHGTRTPFGSLNGSLSTLSAANLGSLAARAVFERTKVPVTEVDEVLFGNVIGAGLGQNVARQVAIAAGVPNSVGATTVSKVCGSGMRAVILAAQSIQCGDADLVLAGGCESMSNAPYLLPKARSGYRMGNGELIDSMIHDGLWDVYTNRHMGTCGDQCATKYNISREVQDNFAIRSYERALKNWEDGVFAAEAVPVEIKGRKETVVVKRDEDLEKYQGPAKLRGLRPAFGADGMVTAGNASGINDGAAALLVFGQKKKDALKIKPAGRILGHANAAMASDWFTIAPIKAIEKLCTKLSIKPADVDLYEINEAFAVVTLVAMQELKLDPEKVNVAGGAVAIGHPIGATGARLVSTLLYSLERSKKRLGIACACIGGGEASAIAVERCG